MGKEKQPKKLNLSAVRHLSAYRQEFMRVKAASCSATTRTVICVMNALKMRSSIRAEISYWKSDVASIKT